MRSAWFVAGLALRRLRRRDSGALVTALGLAVATAVLAGVLAGTTIATDRSTAQAIEDDSDPCALGARGVVRNPRRSRANGSTCSTARSTTRSPTSGSTDRAGSCSSARAPWPARYVGITAVDGLAPHVVLRSGRMPRRCTPQRCEVLRLRGRGAIPTSTVCGWSRSGRRRCARAQLYGDFVRSTDAAVAGNPRSSELGQAAEYHRPPPPPLVVAEGRAALAASPALARTYRTYAWVWPVNPGSPRLWQVDDLLGRTERARIELAAQSSFDVEAPVEELRAAERAADVAGNRLLLVGGEGAALLLAFTILAARGMRRDLEGARRRLTWSGARRWQLALLGGVESTAVAFGGVLGGWLVGVVVAGVAARLAGAPVTDVLRESVLSPRGLGLAAATAARRGCARVDHGLAEAA